MYYLYANSNPTMSLIARYQYLHNAIAPRWGVFLLVFFVVVFISYAFLYAIDFIPEPLSEETIERREARNQAFFAAFRAVVPDNTTTQVPNDGLRPASQPESEVGLTRVVIPDPEPAPEADATDTTPNRIIIDALNKEVPVLNPQSRAVADLDAALLDGVVRHPDSADFAREGNMLILGHSSYLPNVLNRNFQAFNGIQELTWGDLIRLQSDDMEYVYRVDRVYQALASEVVVEHRWGTPMLTLATCDSFGSKEDRFIVEASLISSQPL